jgi:hypothetical protein
MTWRELKDYLNSLDERFLDTEVQVYDCEEQITYTDTMFSQDDDDTDYLIDLNQPQIWFRTSDVTFDDD